MKTRTTFALLLIAVASLVVYVIVSPASKNFRDKDISVSTKTPTAEPGSDTKPVQQETTRLPEASTEGDANKKDWDGKLTDYDKEMTLESSTETGFIGDMKGRHDVDYESIQYLSSQEVVEGLLEGIEVEDDMWLNFGQRILQDRAQNDNGELVALLVTTIEKEKRASMREYLVKLLGNFGTTHSVEALFEMASRDDPLARGLRKSVWYAIESIPAHDSRQQNRYREELSPILESGLEGTRTDPAFYRAVTQAIALIGTASGTELLLKEWQTARSKEEQEVVEFALMSTSNPNAVPVLESVLQEDANLVSGVGQVAGSALASMGDKDATRALLEWAAGTEGATMRAEALAWLAQAAVERESLEMIREAGKRYEFRDPVTKEEIVKMAQTIEQEGNKVEML